MGKVEAIGSLDAIAVGHDKRAATIHAGCCACLNHLVEIRVGRRSGRALRCDPSLEEIGEFEIFFF